MMKLYDDCNDVIALITGRNLGPMKLMLYRHQPDVYHMASLVAYSKMFMYHIVFVESCIYYWDKNTSAGAAAGAANNNGDDAAATTTTNYY